MATRSEEFFHDKWLGMVQTESDGLVVAKPVLLAAGCGNRQPPAVQEKLRELCPEGPEDAPRRIADLIPLFVELLDFDTDLFDEASKIPDEVSLYAPEGPQSIRPTLGLLRQDDPVTQEGAGSPASNAAAKYVALLWDVTEIDGEQNLDAIGLKLDKPEITTGGWSYPAAAKFDRLLRHCRVPVGILTNREVIRLVYAPHGESSGHITFRVDDMATVGGRPILDAMIMLLCANQWFGVVEEDSLPSLLRRSREYQGTVTTDLAEQVFAGLETLLKGFQTAAERDRSGLLRDALGRDEDHLYRGLLTVMLRLVFILYAEDRNLLPVDHPLYAKQMSLLGLFERLQRDHGNFPDSMNNRFGAWGHIISLSRAIYLGVEHGDFHIPPRQGDLFDPHRYPFLEGWSGGSAPIVTQTARAEVKVPTVDDGTVFALLQSLLIFQGQRLSYRTLDVEQIGSVYEALMGYQVSPCESPAVAIKIKNKKGAAKYWVEPEAVLARPAGQRVKWLQGECGFDKPVATKIKKALDDVGKKMAGDQNAAIEALLPLAAGKKGLAHEQRASIGQYVLQPGSERRRSGTQYTPRSLTEPIVRKTLEPLIRCLGEEPTAEQLLELKLCDPAMGSGAFLVECCRQLAEKVEAAWARAHEIEEIAVNCPEGNVIAHARRLVAQRCLYGVDKNAMAVQLAKLSLWLFTLARDLPFTFLDHSFRHGDSLVGLDLEQIRAFHWKPEKQLTFLGVEVKRALDEVVAIRQEIHQLAGDATPEGQKLKAQRLFDANDATEKVRRVADVCVGAFFSESAERARLAERELRQDKVSEWLESGSDVDDSIEDWVSEIRDQQTPFHWWLEFPEVFFEERPDPLRNGEVDGAAYMDGFVGNPPFLGGKKIRGALGDRLVPWLCLDSRASGNADLSAHFILRASRLAGLSGILGMIATNTIAEGASRASSTRALIAEGWTISFADCDFDWPGDASVVATSIGLAKGVEIVERMLDGRSVDFINSFLRTFAERPDPLPLAANLDLAGVGCVPVGTAGFCTDSSGRDELVSVDGKHAPIFLFIGAEDIGGRSDLASDRYIVNFGEMPLKDAEGFPSTLEYVRGRLYEERQRNSEARYGRLWWQFGKPQTKVYEALQSQDRCFVILSSGSPHLICAAQPVDRVFANTLTVVVDGRWSRFASIQSRIHEAWARLLSSSMKQDLRYTPTTCLASFPFPEMTSGLDQTGSQLHRRRAEVCSEMGAGLTTVYNLMKDPDCTDTAIEELRSLHEDLDRRVLEAYGLGDISVPSYCPHDSEEKIAIDAFADTVIENLYVLNEARVAEDARMGVDGKPVKRPRSTSNRTPKSLGTTKSLPGMSDTEGAS